MSMERDNSTAEEMRGREGWWMWKVLRSKLATAMALYLDLVCIL